MLLSLSYNVVVGVVGVGVCFVMTQIIRYHLASSVIAHVVQYVGIYSHGPIQGCNMHTSVVAIPAAPL